MTQQKLTDLLSKATNYLNPGFSSNDLSESRKKFIACLNEHELFDELLAEIDKNPMWETLATEKGIQFFVDYESPALGKNIKYPYVRTPICELNRIPTVKIVVKAAKTLY